ncbi:MAG: 8-amino-7-oxononanoate synthase [Nitrospiraceae bacterium]|nr:8-amino-7-oxononanoate synthase [Nitrospiraceae bacterium]
MFENELKILADQDLMRHIRDRQTLKVPFSRKLMLNSTELVNFASNDYLGLSSHPKLMEAVIQSLHLYGFGAGSSRLLSGGTELHAELEDKTAAFKGTEAALLLNSGYTANSSAIPALAGSGDLILSDELNHASIIDGCRLSRARTIVYSHCSLSEIERILSEEKAGRKLIVTDSVFSMNGDIAPIDRINDLCLAHGALLYIDDAHATGVLGRGRGSLAHFGLKPADHIIQMGTFSKALGSLGAFIAAAKEITDLLTSTCRGLIFSTALPACAAAASIAALKLVEQESSLVDALWTNRQRLFSGIERLGLNTFGSASPIIPIQTGTLEQTIRHSEFLFNRGIYAPTIKPPSVSIPRIRLTTTASHTGQDLDALLNALAELR